MARQSDGWAAVLNAVVRAKVEVARRNSALYACPICRRERRVPREPDMRVYCECGNYMDRVPE